MVLKFLKKSCYEAHVVEERLIGFAVFAIGGWVFAIRNESWKNKLKVAFRKEKLDETSAADIVRRSLDNRGLKMELVAAALLAKNPQELPIIEEGIAKIMLEVDKNNKASSSYPNVFKTPISLTMPESCSYDQYSNLFGNTAHIQEVCPAGLDYQKPSEQSDVSFGN